MHERLRFLLLRWFGELVSRHPATVLALALLLAAASVAVTATKLKFESDRNALISKDLVWNQRFKEWMRSFPGAKDLVVVVDVGEKADDTRRRDAESLVLEMGHRLIQEPSLKHVVWGFSTRALSPRLLRLSPMEEMHRRLEQMTSAKTMLASETLGDLLATLPAMMRRDASASESKMPPKRIVEGVASLATLLDAAATGLETPADQPFDFGAKLTAGTVDPWQYLQSANGRLYFIRIHPTETANKINAVQASVEAIRKVMAETMPRHPGFEVGLTGIDVVEADETRAATVDSTWASILAVVLITVLMFVSFHSVRGPLMAMGSLLVGVAWSFGFLTLAIGHLQVISVVFTVMLLGLGIAYGIHLVCAFEVIRHTHDDTTEGFIAAMKETFVVIGPGIFTGAVTTSAAFVTTWFTDFTGVAEMGYIAAVGIMLCLVSQFTVFPALLRLMKPGHGDVVRMDDRAFHVFEPRWLMPFVRWPRLTLVVAAGLTIASAWLTARHMHFDYDLLKLQPVNSPGVIWSQRIMHDGGESIYYAVSMADSLDEARRRAASLRQLPTVATRLGGAGLLMPADEPEKLDLLRAARQQLSPALDEALDPSPTTQAAPPDLLQQLGALRLALRAAMFTKMPDEILQALQPAGQALDRAAAAVGPLDAAEQQRRARRIETQYAAFRMNIAAQISAALDDAPLTPDDLPAELVSSVRDDKGRYVLEVHPNPPAGVSPLDPGFLPAFVTQLEMIDPDITGAITQIYRSGALIRDAYIQAGVWAFALVALLVLADFRSLHDALLSLVPVAIGFTLTFAIMRLAGMNVNPANIIVLPLMFGIGVDNGVHVIHRYRQHPDEVPPGLTQGTGKGITVTTLTTVIGFACLLLARHRGIQSLGFVLSVGIALTLLACWAVLPAWLTLHRRVVLRRTRQSA
ncbi:MAG: MMPL family transporter [Phycisphaeraceae bacterium]|nr:MMPL family transporter [Phycisphaeraceae bacterium]